MKYLLAIPLLFSLIETNAQNFNTARSEGMGLLSTVFTDQNSLFNNPAGLASIEKAAATLGIERRFWWADVNVTGFGFALPTSSGAFGLSVQSFGFSEFHRQKVGLAYARKIWRAVRIGGQIDYVRLAIPEYGSTGKLSFEIGLQADLTDELVVGTHIAHPYQIEIVDGENLATVFQIGFLYSPSKVVAIGMELEKDVDFPLSLKCGVEYMPIQKLTVRTGYSSDPSNFHFGVGFLLNEKLSIDVGNRYDLALGLASTIGLGYVFK